MGMVVQFHARASAGSRAASAAKVSAVKPASRARSVRKIESHHSDGMLLRCGHFLAAATPAPISAANASGESHSPTTSRKLETMLPLIGQSVLNCKANLSHDLGNPGGYKPAMAQDEGYSDFYRAFIARTKAAREASGYTQAQIGELLDGLAQDHYKQFEGRSPLPHHLIPRFCLLCRVNMMWMLTGKGKGPAEVPAPAPRRRQVKRAVA